jgi:hypothetical protein
MRLSLSIPNLAIGIPSPTDKASKAQLRSLATSTGERFRKMSSQIGVRKIRLVIAAVIAAVGIGATTTAAVSVSSAPAPSVSHSLAGPPWCCIPAATAIG